MTRITVGHSFISLIVVLFFLAHARHTKTRSYCLNKIPSSESPPARPRSLDSIEIQPTNHICKSEWFKCGACYFAAEEGQRNGTGLALKKAALARVYVRACVCVCVCTQTDGFLRVGALTCAQNVCVRKSIAALSKSGMAQFMDGPGVRAAETDPVS